MSRIQSIARFKIHPGKTEEFKALSADCMRLAREKDTGTIRYDIFLNDDETEAVVYEEYESSEAAMKHFENMGDNAAAIFAIVDMEGETWGEPSGEHRKGLEQYGVRILKPYMRLSE
jgi:quinol monooxygenase YgiN